MQINVLCWVIFIIFFNHLILPLEFRMDNKDAFNSWIKSDLKKKSTSLMSDEVYKQLLDNLKYNNGTKVIKKRQQRKKYEILNYPNLNLTDILCVSTESVRLFCLWYIFFFFFFFLMKIVFDLGF